MNLRTCFNGVIGATAILITSLSVLPANAASNVPLPKATDTSTSPGTNEFWLTATNVTVTIGANTNVQASVYMDDPPGGGGVPPGLPSPLIQSSVGNVVICHFKNNLINNSEGASIHWHGIELDNDSDGTGVTQDSVLPGQTYLYRFQVPRPGLFWYHSHMMPGKTTFAGMYGPIFVPNPGESNLIASKILPPSSNTFQLVMGDINFNTTNGFIGVLWKNTSVTPNVTNWTDVNTLVQACEAFELGETNNQSGCQAIGPAAPTIMVNGNTPSPTNAVNLTPSFMVPSGQRIRLQLFNEALIRDFYLTLLYPSNNPAGDTNLYRIGGQGGLLDNARLEGGTQGGYNFVYNKGNIMLGSGIRADVLVNLSGSNGDVIKLVGNPLPSGWAQSGSYPTNYPIAYFIINTNLNDPSLAGSPVANNSPILAGTSGTNITLAFLPTNALLVPPCTNFGSSNPTMTLQNGTPANTMNTNFGNGPNMDGYAAFMLDGNEGDGSWLNVPHPPTARYAHVGDVLELTLANLTGGQGGGAASTHPYHLHGFSMQPLRIVNAASPSTTLYTYPYNEFLDTIEVYPNQALVFRVRLDDRPIFADSATGGPVVQSVNSPNGGAIGRWLMHCHIFLHGGIGMISEIDVMASSNFPPLNITCPSNITQTAASPAGVPVTFAPTVSGGAGPLLISNSPPSGSTFPIGTTTVTNTVFDQCGSNTCSFTVTVVPPNVPAGIWQPLQPPDLSTKGVSTLSTAGTGSETVADDFLCTNSGYISDVHVWGAWLNDIIDTNATFEVKFWMDVPAGSPPPSRPGWQAWEQLFPPGTYSNSLAGPSINNEMFYDPSGPNFGVDTLVYRYDFSIPTNTAFVAYASNYYWVSVTAYSATYPAGVTKFFGWKSTPPPYHFHDDANWSDSLFGPDWTELIYPPPAFYSGLSMDMSFALNTGIPVLPPPIVPGIAPVLTASVSSVTTASANTGNAPSPSSNITITWSGGGILQNASQVSGPWTNVNGGASPYVIPVNKPSSFYRVVLPGP